jgi:hypothetical protein
VKVSGLDYRFSLPHQKRGDASSPWIVPMRSVSCRRGTPRVRLSRTLPQVGTLLVLLAVVGVLAASSARAAYAGEDSNSYAWSNGSVTCVFSGTLPSVTVSATGLNDTGMGVSLAQIDEASPLGIVVAIAAVNAAAWEPANASSSEWYTLNYAEFMNVTSTTTPAHSLGQAWVSIGFALNRTPPNATLADVVAFQLSVQDWPWQSAADGLALVVPIWSAHSTSEHMTVSSASSPRVESVRNSNGQPLEYFEVGTTATTNTGAPVPVTSQTTIADDVATTVLTLGHGAGGATELTYQATLGITPNTRVLGLPLYDYLAVASGAGLVALVVGVGARRVRQHPSDLTYVEESE